MEVTPLPTLLLLSKCPTPTKKRVKNAQDGIISQEQALP